MRVLWNCTVLPVSQSWYVTCYGKGGADLFLYGRMSQALWHIFIHVWFFAVSWPWGSLGCGCELDLNSLIPYETTGISGSLPPACNETFGKNKEDGNTKDTKMQKFFVFTQMMSVLFKMVCFLVLRKWLLSFLCSCSRSCIDESLAISADLYAEWFLGPFPL